MKRDHFTYPGKVNRLCFLRVWRCPFDLFDGDVAIGSGSLVVNSLSRYLTE